MKQIFLFLLFILLSFHLLAQKEIRKGAVSFISSQNVYVRFEQTEGIQVGDTLYQYADNKYIASLLVQNLSSISCVCLPVKKIIVVKGAEIQAFIQIAPKVDPVADKQKTALEVNESVIESARKPVEPINQSNKIGGRLSVNSYSVYDKNQTDKLMQRFRYNLSFNASRIANTGLSVETNMAFSHKLGVNYGFKESLKIYNAAVNYSFSDKLNVSFGRKINASMANVGAADGVQIEYNGVKFSYGALAGSRPDYFDYSINPTLFQFGAFVNYKYRNNNKYAQTSLALFNQTNNFITDRRFAYLQHSNSLLKKLDFFGSLEIDLYGKLNEQLSTKFDLTSAYASLRYRPFDNLSLSLVYDARKNVHYYETFKNLPDSIFDRETRQGLRFQTSYRPFKFLTTGGSFGYRKATTFSSESMHGNAFITIPQLPFIETRFTADATWLKTPYIDGMMYSGTLSRDFLNSNLSTDLIYRYIDYKFPTTADFQQHIVELMFHYRITKKLFISTNLEASKDLLNNFNGRLFLNLTQRF